MLAIPGLVIAGIVVQGLFEVMTDFVGRVLEDPEAFQVADSRALQAELEVQLQTVAQPPADLAALSAASGGVAIAVALIGYSLLTAAALAAAAGRPISVTDAFRLVAARGDGLLKPIVALGVGWVAVSTALVVLQSSTAFQAWAGTRGSARSVLLDNLLGVMTTVATIGVLILAVRFALFIPVILVEALGLGPGLVRGARLTQGVQIRLGLAMAGIVILHALTVGITATAVGIVVGLSAGSVAAGFGTYVIVSLFGNLLWAPMLPAMLALVYLERTGDRAASAPART